MTPNGQIAIPLDKAAIREPLKLNIFRLPVLDQGKRQTILSRTIGTEEETKEQC